MHANARSFDEVMGARRSLARISDVFNKVSPKSLVGTAPSIGGFFRDVNESRPTDVPDGIGTLAGAAVGIYAYRGTHPVLGAFGGASLARNVPALFDGGLRKIAVGNMIQTGAGIAGSLYMPKNPALGFAVGFVIGGVVKYYGGLR